MVWVGMTTFFPGFQWLFVCSIQHSSRLLGEKVQNAQKQSSGIVLVCGRNGLTIHRDRSILTKKQVVGNTSLFDFRELQGASVGQCQSVLSGGTNR